MEVPMEMYDPPHPGEILKEDYLKPLNLSVTQTAVGLGGCDFGYGDCGLHRTPVHIYQCIRPGAPDVHDGFPGGRMVRNTGDGNRRDGGRPVFPAGQFAGHSRTVSGDAYGCEAF